MSKNNICRLLVSASTASFLMLGVMSGCNRQNPSGQVNYGEAVSTIQNIFPIPVTRDWDKTRPAYRNEREIDVSRQALVDLPGGLTVKHEELIPGQEFMVTIQKVWKSPPSRKTTISVTKTSGTSCDVQVESVHYFGPNTAPIRDVPYENARMTEIAEEFLTMKRKR